MKVLILTIQEDPPSLDTYDEEDVDYDVDNLGMDFEEDFSKSFRLLVDACLQKDPAKRPKSLELLQSKHLNAMQDAKHRDARRTAIARQVCDLVEDVGSSTSSNQSNARALPGNSPVSIILSKEENRPAGTTWVFADGSQVLASSTTTNATVDDVMEEFHQFGLQTGGEHYTREQQQQGQPTAIQKEEPDDLNAFMDEFELNTQGENFRREDNN
jgi:serine/threonine-protein kinase OSR1/STK39